MISVESARSHTHGMAARLLLALLLAVAPVLTFAGVALMPATAGADIATTPTDRPMPCHTDAGQSAEPAQPACPHCAGEGPLSQCQCCGFAAPAGLISLDPGPAAAPADGMPAHLKITDPLPESPGDRLYRPPIFQS